MPSPTTDGSCVGDVVCSGGPDGSCVGENMGLDALDCISARECTALLIFAHLVYVLTLLNAKKQLLFSGYLQTKEHNLESINKNIRKPQD